MTYETENAADKAAFVENVLKGLDDPEDNNGRRVKAGAEVVSSKVASAEQPDANISTKLSGEASESAVDAANLNSPSGSPDMRAVAVEYAKIGLCPTPLRPNGKAPFLPGFNTRYTSDPAKVFALFSDALRGPRDCNIGIVNGALLPNGRELFIVDPDTKERSGEPGVVPFNRRVEEI